MKKTDGVIECLNGLKVKEEEPDYTIDTFVERYLAYSFRDYNQSSVDISPSHIFSNLTLTEFVRP